MPCWFADDNCLPKGNNSKNNIGESRKKAGDSSDDFLVLVIVENRLYFLFKIYLTEKNYVTAAILRTHLWHAAVRLPTLNQLGEVFPVSKKIMIFVYKKLRHILIFEDKNRKIML